MPVEAPFPPRELAERVGALYGDDLVEYDEVGKAIRAEILRVLPADWTFAGKDVLDFGCGAGRTLRHFLEEAKSGTFYGSDIDAPSIAWLEANLSPPLHVFANGEEPPLPLSSASLDLIWTISVFTHISDHWAAWLVELHRLLRDDGMLLATILGPALSDEWTAAAPDPRVARGEALEAGDRVGMNVLHYGRSWDQGGPAVFLSEWWIKEHWGRAFEILALHEDGFAAIPPDWRGQGVVLARKRPGRVSIEELERTDPGDPREIEALRHNVRQLHHESQKAQEAVAWLEGERAQT